MTAWACLTWLPCMPKRSAWPRRRRAGDQAERARQGGGVLIESLSPFEMSLQATARTMPADRVERSARPGRIATEAANRELESFSYSVAHYLRAPAPQHRRLQPGLAGRTTTTMLDDEARQYLRYLREFSAADGAADRRSPRTCRALTRSELKKEAVDLSALAHDVLAKLARREPARSRSRFSVQDGMTAEGDSGC